MYMKVWWRTAWSCTVLDGLGFVAVLRLYWLCCCGFVFFFAAVLCDVLCTRELNLENGKRARRAVGTTERQTNVVTTKFKWDDSRGGSLRNGWENFQGSFLEKSWKEQGVKAEELADGDANPDVDHQASNSAILCVLWGMEENRGCPLLPSHPKLDCAHEGDVI